MQSIDVDRVIVLNFIDGVTATVKPARGEEFLDDSRRRQSQGYGRAGTQRLRLDRRSVAGVDGKLEPIRTDAKVLETNPPTGC